MAEALEAEVAEALEAETEFRPAETAEAAGTTRTTTTRSTLGRWAESEGGFSDLGPSAQRNIG